jgi:hypothetical protein
MSAKKKAEMRGEGLQAGNICLKMGNMFIEESIKKHMGRFLSKVTYIT